MARYAEWNKFVQNLKTDEYGETNVNEIGIAFEKATADVAPKSEVARLEAELDDLKRDTIPKLQYGLQRANAMGRDLEVELEAMRTAANSYKMHYEGLAREIFAEIEKCVEVALMNGHIETPILCIGHGTFAELKKKYTGEQK